MSLDRSEIVVDAVADLCLQYNVEAVLDALATYVQDWADDILAGQDDKSVKARELAKQLNALLPLAHNVSDR